MERAILVNATLRNAHLETYKDRVDDKECKRTSGGLLGLYWSNPDREPSLDEICRWTSTHPDSEKPIKLPHSFLCKDDHGEQSAKRAYTNLRNADLTGADLTNAILTGTDLTRAIWYDKQIDHATILCHTFLPPNMREKMNRDCPPSPGTEERGERTNTMQECNSPHDVAKYDVIEQYCGTKADHIGCLGAQCQAMN